VTVHLIRHAHAGRRSEWVGDDRLRPLSDRGRLQSDALVDTVGDLTVGRIVSSPYVRCMQTMEALATAHDTSIEALEAFAEGADVDEAYAILASLDAADGVACSHGDLIPLLLRRLVDEGMDTDGPLIDQKGSTWIIEFRDQRPFRGTYVPPVDKR